MNSILRVAWASHSAAKFACEHWHYSGSIPVFKTAALGVWENRAFIGAVIFSRGATPNIGSPYGLPQTEICELTRVALKEHLTPVSRIVAIGVRILRNHCPGIRLIVSFADEAQGHHGGIYQADNWIYAGKSPTHTYKVNGEIVHPKSLHSKYGTGGQSIEWLQSHVDSRAERLHGFKHRYLKPLDKKMRARISKLALPYPKRVGSDTSDTPAILAGKGGATPTPTLYYSPRK